MKEKTAVIDASGCIGETPHHYEMVVAEFAADPGQHAEVYSLCPHPDESPIFFGEFFTVEEAVEFCETKNIKFKIIDFAKEEGIEPPPPPPTKKEVEKMTAAAVSAAADFHAAQS